jgi:hypothetical protein
MTIGSNVKAFLYDFKFTGLEEMIFFIEKIPVRMVHSNTTLIFQE